MLPVGPKPKVGSVRERGGEDSRLVPKPKPPFFARRRYSTMAAPITSTATTATTMRMTTGDPPPPPPPLPVAVCPADVPGSMMLEPDPDDDHTGDSE